MRLKLRLLLAALGFGLPLASCAQVQKASPRVSCGVRQFCDSPVAQAATCRELSDPSGSPKAPEDAD